MSVVDEMARDWAKRLCVTQLDYCKKMDLLTLEYERMSDADKKAVCNALGTGVFVFSLAGISPPIMRRYVGEQPDDTKFGVVMKIGPGVPLAALVKICGQLPTEVLTDLIRQVVLEDLRNRMEEAIINAAEKGQA